MISLELLGFIYCLTRVMLHLCCKLSLFLLKNNLMPRSRLSGVIMVWNFIADLFKSFTLPKELPFSLLVLIPLNKMVWLRGNISTFCKSPGPLCFSLISYKNIREKPCSQPPILSTEHLSLPLVTKHLLKFSMLPHYHTLLFTP